MNWSLRNFLLKHEGQSKLGLGNRYRRSPRQYLRHRTGSSTSCNSPTCWFHAAAGRLRNQRYHLVRSLCSACKNRVNAMPDSRQPCRTFRRSRRPCRMPNKRCSSPSPDRWCKRLSRKCDKLRRHLIGTYWANLPQGRRGEGGGRYPI